LWLEVEDVVPVVAALYLDESVILTGIHTLGSLIARKPSGRRRLLCPARAHADDQQCEGAKELMFQPTDELAKTTDVMMKNFLAASAPVCVSTPAEPAASFGSPRCFAGAPTV
jgi:hypothetical protein